MSGSGIFQVFVPQMAEAESAVPRTNASSQLTDSAKSFLEGVDKQKAGLVVFGAAILTYFAMRRILWRSRKDEGLDEEEALRTQIKKI